MENQTRQEKHNQNEKYWFQQFSSNFKGNSWILYKMLIGLYLLALIYSLLNIREEKQMPGWSLQNKQIKDKNPFFFNII